MRPRGVSWMNRGIGTYSPRAIPSRPLRAIPSRSLRIFSGLLFAVWLVVRGNGQIDCVAVLIDNSCVVNEELQCFPTSDIRSYRLQRASPFELAPDPLGLLVGALGQAGDLGIELFLGCRNLFLRNDRSQREIGEHRARRAHANLVDERLRLLARYLEIL